MELTSEEGADGDEEECFCIVKVSQLWPDVDGEKELYATREGTRKKGEFKFVTGIMI